MSTLIARMTSQVVALPWHQRTRRHAAVIAVYAVLALLLGGAAIHSPTFRSADNIFDVCAEPQVTLSAEVRAFAHPCQRRREHVMAALS